tara:strand:+ start:14765 stop:15274 length:510 start_codon:yes stop_codon:yes gene_type:complete
MIIIGMLSWRINVALPVTRDLEGIVMNPRMENQWLANSCRLLAIVATLLLGACASVAGSVVDLGNRAEHNLHCGTLAGVTLKDDGSQVVIALGQRPTPGYQVMLDQSEMLDGVALIRFHEQQPQQGMAVAQVMTSPCMVLTLPEEWQSMRISSSDSGGVWQFYNPANPR